MTRYIDVNDLAQLVASKGLETCLAEMAECIREDYARWPQFDKCARLANHSPNGVIELMPVSDASLYAFKYVNGHPSNTQANLLTVMAFGALGDVDTGTPVLLSEMTLATALRTAATSVLAARYMARDDALSMALIGNCSQSEFQAIAFHALLNIEEIRLFDIDAKATAKIARNLGQYPDLKIVIAASVADAVRGADIVTTVTADKAYNLSREHAEHPVILVCEHASAHIPAPLERLGLDARAAEEHIAWDIGALALAQHLSQTLDATLI